MAATRRLYLFHFFNSVATAVIANPVFLDTFFRRQGVDLAQLGFIKGFAMWAPLTLNLLLSPLVLRLRIDAAIAGWGYVVRVALAYGFLVLPLLTDDPGWLTAGFAILLMVAMIPPSFANNSLAVLCKAHLPPQRLGWHMGVITVLWNVPFYVVAIGCSWYVERYGRGGDDAFYRALFHVFLLTTVFQVPATLAILRLRRTPPAAPGAAAAAPEAPPAAPEADAPAAVPMALLAAPFRDPRFRSLLLATATLSALAAMVTTFLVPYLIEAQRMELPRITTIELGNALLGIAMIPLWGRVADRYGGRNVLRLCLLGVAAGVLCLSQEGLAWVLASAALAWAAAGGVFGAGVNIARRYLTLSLGDPRRSNVDFAAAEFAVGCGLFVGGVAGGLALEALKVFNPADQPHRHYFLYFACCGVLFAVLGELVTALLREPHAPVSRRELLVQLFRTLRIAQWKWW